MFCYLGFPLPGVQLIFWDKKPSDHHNIVINEDEGVAMLVAMCSQKETPIAFMHIYPETQWQIEG
jgi:hypothetical protein